MIQCNRKNPKRGDIDVKYDCSDQFDLNVIFLKLIGVCRQANAELPENTTSAKGEMPILAEFQRAMSALCGA